MESVHTIRQKCTRSIISSRTNVNIRQKTTSSCCAAVNEMCLRHFSENYQHYSNKKYCFGCCNVSQKFIHFYIHPKICSLLNFNINRQRAQICIVRHFSRNSIKCLEDNLSIIDRNGTLYKNEQEVDLTNSTSESKCVELFTSLVGSEFKLPTTNTNESRYSVKDNDDDKNYNDNINNSSSDEHNSDGNDDDDDDHDHDDFMLKEYEQLVLNAQTSLESEQGKDEVKAEHVKVKEESIIESKPQRLLNEMEIKKDNERMNVNEWEEIEELIQETLSALPSNCTFVKLTEFTFKINAEVICEHFGSVLNFLQRFPAHFECEKVSDIHGVRWFVKRRCFTECEKNENRKEEEIELSNPSTSAAFKYNVTNDNISGCSYRNLYENNIKDINNNENNNNNDSNNNNNKNDIIVKQNAKHESREELEWEEELYNSEILEPSEINYYNQKHLYTLQDRRKSVVSEEAKTPLELADKNSPNKLITQNTEKYINNNYRNTHERSDKELREIECEQELCTHRRPALQNLSTQIEISDKVWNELSSLLPLNTSISFVEFKQNLKMLIQKMCISEKSINVSEEKRLEEVLSSTSLSEFLSSSSSSERLTICGSTAYMHKAELSSRQIADRTVNTINISAATIKILNTWPSGVLRLIHTHYKDASRHFELSSDSYRIARTGILLRENYKLWNSILYNVNDMCKEDYLQRQIEDEEREDVKDDEISINGKVNKRKFSNGIEEKQLTLNTINFNSIDVNDNDADENENFFGVNFEKFFEEYKKLTPTNFVHHIEEEHRNSEEKQYEHKGKAENASQCTLLELTLREEKNSARICKEHAISKQVITSYTEEREEEDDTNAMDNTLFVPSTQLGSLGRKNVLYKGLEDENNSMFRMMHADNYESHLAQREPVIRESIGQLNWALLASAPQIVHSVKESAHRSSAIKEKTATANSDLNMQINGNKTLHNDLQSNELCRQCLQSTLGEHKEEETIENYKKKKRTKGEMTLTPEEMEKRHTKIALEKGWRTPRELLELFVECIPTFYVPVTKLVISDVLAHTLGLRNALGTVIRIYSYFFQTIITPDKTKLVRLHESLVHPHRGTANKFYEQYRLSNWKENEPTTYLGEVVAKKSSEYYEEYESKKREIEQEQEHAKLTTKKQKNESVDSSNNLEKKEYSASLQKKCSKLILERSVNTQKFPVLQTVIKSRIKLQPLSEKSKLHQLDKNIASCDQHYRQQNEIDNCTSSQENEQSRNTKQTICSTITEYYAQHHCCDKPHIPETVVSEHNKVGVNNLPKQRDTREIDVKPTNDVFSCLKEKSNYLNHAKNFNFPDITTLPLFLRAALTLPYERFVTVKQAAEMCNCTLPEMYNLASPTAESQTKYALLLTITDINNHNSNTNNIEVKSKTNTKPQYVRLRPLLLAPNSTNNLNIEELPDELVRHIKPTWIPLEKIMHKLSKESMEQLEQLIQPLQVNKCNEEAYVDHKNDQHNKNEIIDLQRIAHLLRMYGSICWLDEDKMLIRKFTNRADLDDIIHLSILLIRHTCSHNYEYLQEILDRLTRQITSYKYIYKKSEEEATDRVILNDRHGLLHMLQSTPKQSLIKVIKQHTKLF